MTALPLIMKVMAGPNTDWPVVDIQETTLALFISPTSGEKHQPTVNVRIYNDRPVGGWCAIIPACIYSIAKA